MSRIVSLTVSQSVSQSVSYPIPPPARAERLLLTKKLCHIKSFVCAWEPASNETALALRWPSALALPSPLLLPFALPSPLAQLQQESDPGLQIDCPS